MKDKVALWLGISKLILPIALKAAGVPDHITIPVVNLVEDAEKTLGPGTGEQKMTVVVQGVGHGLQLAGMQPETIEMVKRHVERGLDLGIGVVNDIHKLQGETDEREMI